MQNDARKVAVLATGGTIAGTAAQAGDNIGYTAAQLGVQALIEAVPALREVPLPRWEDPGGSSVGLAAFLRAPLELWRIRRRYPPRGGQSRS